MPVDYLIIYTLVYVIGGEAVTWFVNRRYCAVNGENIESKYLWAIFALWPFSVAVGLYQGWRLNRQARKALKRGW